MSLEIAILFRAAPLAKGVLEYMQVIDSLSSKIEKLSQSELAAGIRALEQASNSEVESASLLREARSRFNKAVSLEKEDRLFAAYLGLAVCHFFLNDLKNARTSLYVLSQVDLGIEKRIKLLLPPGMNPWDVANPLVAIVRFGIGLSKRKELQALLKLRELQGQSLKLAETFTADNAQ